MSSDNNTVVGSDTASVAASTLAPALRRVSLDEPGLFSDAYRLGRLRKVEQPKNPSLVIVRWYTSQGKTLGSRYANQVVTTVPKLWKELLNLSRRHSAVAFQVVLPLF